MSVSETRKMQALALELAGELSEAADALAHMAMKANVNGDALFDAIFECVNALRAKFDSEFEERTITSYEGDERR